MKYQISQYRTTLTITADDEDRAALSEIPEDELHSDSEMYNFFDKLTSNSELEWINPEWAGDLTDAPMLGILGEPQADAGIGRLCMGDEKHAWFQPVLERWAWMRYETESLLGALKENGVAVLVGGSLK